MKKRGERIEMKRLAHSWYILDVENRKENRRWTLVFGVRTHAKQRKGSSRAPEGWNRKKEKKKGKKKRWTSTTLDMYSIFHSMYGLRQRVRPRQKSFGGAAAQVMQIALDCNAESIMQATLYGGAALGANWPNKVKIRLNAEFFFNFKKKDGKKHKWDQRGVYFFLLCIMIHDLHTDWYVPPAAKVQL